MLSTTYEEALILAADLHRTQKRKGSDIPYLSHLLSVSALVLENGGTEEEAIAGLLHDAIEDAKDGPEAERVRGEIGDRFGAEVLSIVEACTDADAGEKAVENEQDIEERRRRWRIRKERYIEHLETAPGPVLSLPPPPWWRTLSTWHVTWLWVRAPRWRRWVSVLRLYGSCPLFLCRRLKRPGICAWKHRINRV